jgi:hypothetical protein
MNGYSCTIPGNQFVGYKNERQSFFDGFENGSSFAVIGGRRSGKTSLLLQIRDDIEKNGLHPCSAIISYFSFQEFACPIQVLELFEYLFRLATKKLPGPPRWRNFPDMFPYHEFLENLKLVRRDFENDFGQEWLVIYLIDEMDGAVERLPNSSFFQNLRHFLMVSEFRSHFRIVAAGVKEMARLITGGSSPLNNLRHKYMRTLECDEAMELVEKGFPKTEPGAEKYLFELTGKHPFILQGILEGVSEIDKGLNDETIKDAAERFLNQHSDFQHWFNTFNANEKNIYHCLALSPDKEMSLDGIKDQVGEDPDSYKSINVLSYHGVIHAPSTDKISLRGTLFRDWFLSKMP